MFFFFVGMKKESSAKKRAQVKKLLRFVGRENQNKRQQTQQLFTLKRSCHLPRDIEWF
jgi:site-specific recombinase XerD